MQQFKNISKSAKYNFYLNLLNFVPFLAVLITGLILQVEYHMHRLPDDYLVSGLNRSNWLILHKISASISLAGIITHCILHWKFIVATMKNIFNQKFKTRILSSFYLFLIYIPTSIIAIGSWMFLNHKDAARLALVEIHDKLALLLIIFSVVHIISRLGWMVKTYQKINKMDTV